MSTSGSSASAAGSVVFGHRYLLGRLETRLRDSLAAAGTPSVLEPALVAGIFGEWGAGKSHLLAAVGEVVRGWEKDERKRRPGVLNVVVEFNAWRYEREEHLLKRRGCAARPLAASGERRPAVGLQCAGDGVGHVIDPVRATGAAGMPAPKASVPAATETVPFD